MTQPNQSNLDKKLDEIFGVYIDPQIPATTDETVLSAIHEAKQAIKGKGYKISRSGTGAVYSVLPDAKVPKEFLVIKQTLDAKLIESHIKETGKLPKGIEYNPSRGTALRITVSDNEDN